MQKQKSITDGRDVPYSHPGGKLRDWGSETLTDAELLAVIIGSGTKDCSAMDIANDVMEKFDSFLGMAGKSFDDFLEIKGLGEVNVHRIAATLEIAKRICREVADIK